MEEWRVIEGTDGVYEVSNTGKVRSNNYLGHGKTKELKPFDNGGYKRIKLPKKYKVDTLVHRLVAAAFIPNPDNLPCVNHINGIKDDNRIENLEWCSVSENIHHAVKTGLFDNSLDTIRKSNINSRIPIIAMNIKTKEVKEFESIRTAQHILKTRDIYRVIRKEQRQAKGYIFYYAADFKKMTAEDIEQDIINANDSHKLGVEWCRKRIMVTNIDTGETKVFNSVTEAIEELPLTKSSLYRALKRNGVSKNYKFSYTE